MNATERDVMNYDTVIVGAGPAGLACAIRLRQLDPERSVCVVEKAANLGAHTLSGAIIDPEPLDQLLPAWRQNPPAVCVPVAQDEFQLLTARRAWRLPTRRSRRTTATSSSHWASSWPGSGRRPRPPASTCSRASPPRSR